MEPCNEGTIYDDMGEGLGWGEEIFYRENSPAAVTSSLGCDSYSTHDDIERPPTRTARAIPESHRACTETARSLCFCHVSR